MSASAKDEVAEFVITPSIIDQAYQAARAYPDIKILCPWCRASVIGVDFPIHGGWHEREQAFREEIPSHWMAL